MLIGCPGAFAAGSSVTRDIAYGSDPRQVLDIYQPAEQAQNQPTVIFFYGGFWHTGRKRDYGFLGQTLASHGIVTVIPDFRLFPPTGYPGFLEDAANAVEWAHAHIAEYGGNPQRLFLMGHSSGAYMAVMLALDPAFLMKVHLAPPDLAGVVGLAGLYHITDSQAEIASVFSDIHDPDTVQPARFITGKNPPMLLLVGSRDETVGSSSSVDLNQEITAQGGSSRVIVYPDLGHIGIMLPFSPASHNESAVVSDVVSFIMQGR